MKTATFFALIFAMSMVFFACNSSQGVDSSNGPDSQLVTGNDSGGGSNGTVHVYDGDGNYVDTGVPNVNVSETDPGTVEDYLAECEDNLPRNHGAYVSCIAHKTNELVRLGVITGKEKGVIMKAAAQSDVGKKH